MNTILNNLKTEMKTAQSNIYAIANSIPTSDTSRQYDVMNKIAAINHAYLILDSESNVKNSAIKNTNHKTTKNKTAIINGEPIKVSGVKDAVFCACKTILKNNYKSLKENNDNFKSSVTGIPFASIHKDDLNTTDTTEVRVANKTFYYDATKMTTNNMMLFKKMLRTINLPENYLEMQKQVAQAE